MGTSIDSRQMVQAHRMDGPQQPVKESDDPAARLHRDMVRVREFAARGEVTPEDMAAWSRVRIRKASEEIASLKDREMKESRAGGPATQVAQSFVTGATAGLDKPIAGAVAAFPGGETPRGAMEGVQARRDANREADPVGALATEVAGGLMMPVSLLGQAKRAPGAVAALMRGGRAVGEGVLQGGVSGFGESVGTDNLARGTAFGGGAGGTLAAAFGGVGKVGGMALERMSSKAATRAASGRLAAELGTKTEQVAEPGFLRGMLTGGTKPTTTMDETGLMQHFGGERGNKRTLAEAMNERSPGSGTAALRSARTMGGAESAAQVDPKLRRRASQIGEDIDVALERSTEIPRTSFGTEMRGMKGARGLEAKRTYGVARGQAVKYLDVLDQIDQAVEAEVSKLRPKPMAASRGLGAPGWDPTQFGAQDLAGQTAAKSAPQFDEAKIRQQIEDQIFDRIKQNTGRDIRAEVRNFQAAFKDPNVADAVRFVTGNPRESILSSPDRNQYDVLTAAFRHMNQRARALEGSLAAGRGSSDQYAELSGLKVSLDKVRLGLEGVSPGFEEANSAYRSASVEIEEFEKGRELMAKAGSAGTTTDAADIADALSRSEDPRALQGGGAAFLSKQAGSSPNPLLEEFAPLIDTPSQMFGTRGKAEAFGAMFGPKAIEDLVPRLRDLRSEMEFVRAISGNSQTADKLAELATRLDVNVGQMIGGTAAASMGHTIEATSQFGRALNPGIANMFRRLVEAPSAVARTRMLSAMGPEEVKAVIEEVNKALASSARAGEAGQRVRGAAARAGAARVP